MQSPENQPPTAAASTDKLASATPSASITTTAAEFPSKPLPRPAFWTAVVIAAGLPIVLLATVIIVLVSLNYNFLEWME